MVLFPQKGHITVKAVCHLLYYVSAAMHNIDCCWWCCRFVPSTQQLRASFSPISCTGWWVTRLLQVRRLYQVALLPRSFYSAAPAGCTTLQACATLLLAWAIDSIISLWFAVNCKPQQLPHVAVFAVNMLKPAACNDCQYFDTYLNQCAGELPQPHWCLLLLCFGVHRCLLHLSAHHPADQPVHVRPVQADGLHRGHTSACSGIWQLVHPHPHPDIRLCNHQT